MEGEQDKHRQKSFFSRFSFAKKDGPPPSKKVAPSQEMLSSGMTIRPLRPLENEAAPADHPAREKGTLSTPFNYISSILNSHGLRLDSSTDAAYNEEKVIINSYTGPKSSTLKTFEIVGRCFLIEVKDTFLFMAPEVTDKTFNSLTEKPTRDYIGQECVIVSTSVKDALQVTFNLEDNHQTIKNSLNQIIGNIVRISSFKKVRSHRKIEKNKQKSPFIHHMLYDSYHNTEDFSASTVSHTLYFASGLFPNPGELTGLPDPIKYCCKAVHDLKALSSIQSGTQTTHGFSRLLTLDATHFNDDEDGANGVDLTFSTPLKGQKMEVKHIINPDEVS